MTTDNLDLFSYFTGTKRAYGLFQDRFGTVRRRFTVDIVGSVHGDQLRLEEEFLYDDGETDQRTWLIRSLGHNQFVGTADDIIEPAMGKVSDSSLHWRYSMNLKLKKRTIKVDFDDWMYLMPDQVLINRAEVKKFGLLLGTIFICFKPMPSDSP